MLFIVNDDRLRGTCRHEDFHSRIVIAIRALAERALNAERSTPGGARPEIWPHRRDGAPPCPDYPSISRAASLAFMPSRTPLR
jgi:hypothetical protein